MPNYKCKKSCRGLCTIYEASYGNCGIKYRCEYKITKQGNETSTKSPKLTSTKSPVLTSSSKPDDNNEKSYSLLEIILICMVTFIVLICLWTVGTYYLCVKIVIPTFTRKIFSRCLHIPKTCFLRGYYTCRVKSL